MIKHCQKPFFLFTMVTCLLFAPSLATAQGLPGNDIWLTDLVDGEPQQPQKINPGSGYNNQPHFSVDGGVIYYTSEQPGTDSAVQTDVVAYNLASAATTNISNSEENEYSPTPIPGRNEISVIKGQRQLLVAIDIESGEARVIFPAIEPVGYHGWFDEQEVAMFILGDTFTMETAKLSDESATVVADNIGRTFRKHPDTNEMLFVDKNTKPWQISAYDPQSKTIRVIMPMFPQNEDFTVDSEGVFWTGNGSRLYQRSTDDDRWNLVADFSATGIDNITRLAIDPTDSKIALVSDHVDSD
jgi:hypothetical protein